MRALRIVIFLTFLSIKCYSQSAKEFVKSGDLKAKNENYSGAIEDYGRALEIEPKDKFETWPYDAYFKRGLSKYKLKDYMGAIADYNLAIKIVIYDPFVKYSQNYAYIERGKAKFMLNDYRGAIEDYDWVIVEDKENTTAYIERAKAKYELRDFKGAISDDNIAIWYLENDKEPTVYINRGLSKIALEQIDDGCIDLSKAGELGEKEAYDLIKKFCQ